MKNTMLFVALLTAISLHAITPFEGIEVQARARVQAIEKMKGLWWAAADKELLRLNDLLISQGSYLDRTFKHYFTQDGTYQFPKGMNAINAVFDFDALTKARQTVRDNYNAVATLVNNEKLNNSAFQTLGREIANGFLTLDTTLDRMRVDLRVAYKLDAEGALPKGDNDEKNFFSYCPFCGLVDSCNECSAKSGC